MGRKKKEQGELDVKIKVDDVGKAAQDFLRLKEVKVDAIDDYKEAEQKLIVALGTAHRQTITIEGYTLSIRITEERENISVS